MPQLKNFEHTGDREYPERNLLSQCFLWQKEKDDQDPKNLIKEASPVIVEPPLGRPRIKLEQKPCRGHNEKGNNNVFSNRRFLHDCVIENS